MKDKKITYFFQHGRSKRINSQKLYPVEMFYGYPYIKNQFPNVSFVESNPTKIRTFIQNNIEHRIGNIINIPILFSYFTSFKNYFILRKSDILIFSNHRALISCYPMMLLNKLFGKSPKSIVFFMGLLQKFPNNKFLFKFKIYFIKNILSHVQKVYFLNKSEMDYAAEIFPSFTNNFEYYPFSVDLDFWEKKEMHKTNDILFIGNDGQRDYEFVIDLINKLDNLSFTVVSKFIDKNKIKSNNCKIFDGSWDEDLLSDNDILELYNKSKITIIPLKETLQPSGQSVALQSMACGTPVIITKTKGFWDYENFMDNINIFFETKNNLSHWEKKINLILNSELEKYKYYSESCEEIVTLNYSVQNINKKLKNLINEL